MPFKINQFEKINIQLKKIFSLKELKFIHSSHFFKAELLIYQIINYQ